MLERSGKDRACINGFKSPGLSIHGQILQLRQIIALHLDLFIIVLPIFFLILHFRVSPICQFDITQSCLKEPELKHCFGQIGMWTYQ